MPKTRVRAGSPEGGNSQLTTAEGTFPQLRGGVLKALRKLLLGGNTERVTTHQLLSASYNSFPGQGKSQSSHKGG